jgi:phthiocerol/phenolphthiocerol synthesis type-I polyketide synthase A
VSYDVAMILRSGDDHVAPLYCVHAVSGGVDEYRPLAAALAWPGPIHGITAADPPADKRSPHERLGEIAAAYVDALPRGPVLLLGWSFGGVVAQEMSRRLALRGDEVRFLAILDSRAPIPEMQQRPTDYDTLARGFLNHRALTRDLTPVEPPASTAPSEILTALRTLGAADDFSDEAALERRLRMFMDLIRALFHHDPRPTPVPIHLFESSEEHPSHPKPATLGWEPFTTHVERIFIQGTHFNLLAPRFTESLARTITAYLPSP